MVIPLLSWETTGIDKIIFAGAALRLKKYKQ